MVFKISDPLVMREINKFSVLETIRKHGSISRVEITRRTELSRTTVSAITGALLEKGLIEISHTDEATRGRPRVNLALVADAAYAFGAALSAKGLTFSLVNFRGDVLLTAHHSKDFLHLALDDLTDFIAAHLVEACAAANIDPRKVNGICLGIPALTTPATRTCSQEADFAKLAPFLEQSLKTKTGRAVYLENHSELIGLKIQWYDRSEKNRAIVILNDVFDMCFQSPHATRMRPKNSPALGHTKISGCAKTCSCGQIDCAQAYLSKSALTEQFPDLLDGPKSNTTTGEILTRLAQDENENQNLKAEYLADILGQSLAHVLNLFAPSNLIAMCESPVFLSKYTENITSSLRSNTVADHFQNTKIEFLPLKLQHVALGATALVLKEFYKAPWIAQEAK